MSLIILNSKGSDPELFSNYVTEQIKFPKEAQVCLVSSHINRKLLIDSEVVIDSGGNTLAFQLGTGANPNVALTRNQADYTPHQPILYDFANTTKSFPIVLPDGAAVGSLLNRVMNDKDQTPISPLVGGWASTIATIAPSVQPTVQFLNTPKVPSLAASLGSTTRNSIVEQPGQNKQGGINTTTGLDGSVSEQGLAVFANWVKVTANEGHGNFIDENPLWNTDNGERVGIYTNLASNLGIVGGGYNWQINPATAVDTQDIEGLRGGIFGDRSYATADGQAQSTYVDTNPLTGGTKYDIWWEITRFQIGTGAMTISFYQRPRMNQNDDQFLPFPPYKWGQINTPATVGSVRISMRPVSNPGGGIPYYCMEGYAAVIATATNTIPGASLPATDGGMLGVCKITDPYALNEAPAAADNQQIDLYRHLPIRQGMSVESTNGIMPVYMNAIHHGDDTADMLAGIFGNWRPYTFAFHKSNEFNTGNLDKEFYQAQQRSTIGNALGFTARTKEQTTALMLTDGIVADIGVSTTVPMNHTLVVSLPDLPVSGFFGNSSGSLAAGTLNINAGGQSAPIIGVIPFGSLPIRQPSQDPTIVADGVESLLSGRGEYWSAGIENWVDLDNPTSFSLSSLTCRITDELGNKPLCLEPNTTITIKIRGRREVQRQAGVPGVI